MFEVTRYKEEPITIIRAATAHELADYEKRKLENIEEGAQVNKLEMVRVETPSKKESFASIENKVAKLELGELALKNQITPDEVSLEDLFLIECSLDN